MTCSEGGEDSWPEIRSSTDRRDAHTPGGPEARLVASLLRSS
ncbi:MAG: hypothetical protein NTX42_12970 [Methanothrix sp.]|nr:hypothetical protein [Methanothrix sp.]